MHTFIELLKINLAMLSLTMSLLIHFFRQKFLLNNIETAGLIIPFWYLVNDLIAEVYGHKSSIKIFWYVVACEFAFSLIANLLKIIEIPNFSEDSESLNPFAHKPLIKNINQ